jgi:hypothetical protein
LDRVETLQEDSKGICLGWDKLLDESEFEKEFEYMSEQVVWILLFTSFWYVDFLYGKDPFSKMMS